MNKPDEHHEERKANTVQGEDHGHDVPRWMRFLEHAPSIMLLGGVGSLVFSFLALGVLPLGEMHGEIRAGTPAAYRPMNDLEQIGFDVYKREGCAYCHSQFVRDIPSDIQRFGEPAEAWEFQDQYPHQWGTRRIGPDLSREAGRRSDDWQYAHLFDPRSTVPESMMPAYPWLFEEGENGEVVPTQEAQGVVAYLNYLGRAMQQSGPQTDRGRAGVDGAVSQEGR